MLNYLIGCMRYFHYLFCFKQDNKISEKDIFIEEIESGFTANVL
jgi:hypothetical protein